MAKKRWVGLRSPSFRRTLFVLFLICLFAGAVWVGKQNSRSSNDKQLKQIEQSLNKVENQVQDIQQKAR